MGVRGANITTNSEWIRFRTGYALHADAVQNLPVLIFRTTFHIKSTHRIMQKFVLAVFSLLTLNSFAQTFSNTTGGPIVDTSTVSFPITVSGLPAAIDSTFGLCQACFNIAHTYVG